MADSSVPDFASLRLFKHQSLPNAATTWYSQRVRTYAGTLDELRQLLPTFSRMPFKLEGFVNPRADLIIRNPIWKEAPIPVAMVSKAYELIQYTEICDIMVQTLQQVRGGGSLEGELLLSEFGERMYLRSIIPNNEFDPGDGNPLYLQVHCFNSVDKSVALQIRLGWYRDICMNGLFFGKEAGKIRRFHHLFQSPMNIPEVFNEQVKGVSKEQERIRNWYDQAVSKSEIIEWADSHIARRWGVETAALVFHIIQTGCDGLVGQVRKRTLAHEYPVAKLGDIPGMQGKAHNIFQITQVLSHVAKSKRNIQDQIEMMNDISNLVDPLLNRNQPIRE